MRERSSAASPYQAHSLTCAGIAAPRQCCSTVMACARNDADKLTCFSVFVIGLSVIELEMRPLARGNGGMSRATARHQFVYVVHSAVDIVQQESCSLSTDSCSRALSQCNFWLDQGRCCGHLTANASSIANNQPVSCAVPPYLAPAVSKAIIWWC